MRLYPGEPTPHVEIGDEGHSVPQKDKRKGVGFTNRREWAGWEL